MLKNAAATLEFEDKKAPERFPSTPPRQPRSVQALTLQHPQNGGLVSLHVYHSDPAGHSWSGKVPYASAEKDAALRFEGAQPEEEEEEVVHGLSVVAQQPMNLMPVGHAKNLLPLGQIGWNDNEVEDGIWREDERWKVYVFNMMNSGWPEKGNERMEDRMKRV